MEWTLEEQNAAIAVLGKIFATFEAGKYIPLPVYEALVKCHARISNELAIFDKDGRIYLIQRKAVPGEPYPDQWHCPGVTYQYKDTVETSFARLIKSELGPEAKFEGDPVCAKMYVSVGESERKSSCLTFLFVMRYIGGEMKSKRGQFFALHDLEELHLVKSHREKVIPYAFEYLRSIKA